MQTDSKNRRRGKGGGGEGGGGKRKKGGGGGGGGFQNLGLSEPVYRGVMKMGYRVPTPVQRKALPVCLSGADAVVMARTGSGKTAAFVLPLLERLLAAKGSDGGDENTVNGGSIRAVILSPTRELCLQTLNVTRSLGRYCSDVVRSVGITGGESIESQFASLASRPDVVVATPGRLSHLLREIPDLSLRSVEVLVLDEADRLFEMGLISQIREICSPDIGGMPPPERGNRQTMLFSATMPRSLAEFTRNGTVMGSDPTVVRLDAESTISGELRVGFVTCRSEEKDAALVHLLRDVIPTSGGASVGRAGGGGDREDGDKKANDENGVDDGGGENGCGSGSRGRHHRSQPATPLALVFAATRHHVEYLSTLLSLHRIPSSSIYGTMDHDARQSAISSFRSGRVPVLLVTDVAARGIDVPLIDFVVHHSFPTSAKLFVHRSGRAARAGRVGYCLALVEPDEVAYMVDLHLFLGRPLRAAGTRGGGGGGDNGDEGENGGGLRENSEPPPASENEEYTLAEMTPDMVHYGSVPESVLAEEVDGMQRLLSPADGGGGDRETTEMLRMQKKTCVNAMRQFRRTRPSPSREGLRRAREVLDLDRGSVPPHPVLRAVERARVALVVRGGRSGGGGNDSNGGDGGGSAEQEKLWEERKDREDFLRAMARFRPKETIFEAHSTAASKPGTVTAQVDKRSKRNPNVASDNAQAVMKSMRRQMRLARNKDAAMVVAGSSAALAINGDVGVTEEEQIASSSNHFTFTLSTNDGNNLSPSSTEVKAGEQASTENICEHRSIKTKGVAVTGGLPVIARDKRRLSKAERKRMKNIRPNTTLDGLDHTASLSSQSSVPDGISCSGDVQGVRKRTKYMRGSDFRDLDNFIDLEKGFDARQREVEASMQPSASEGSNLRAGAMRLEEAMLDLVGDENEDLVKRHRVMRWDRSKKKYIQTTLGAETGGISRTKRLKLESGQVIKNDKAKVGELYEKWQRKTNRSVGRSGVFDDLAEDSHVNQASGIKKIGNRHGKDNKLEEKMGKSAAQIRREREVKKDAKIKNMKKADRKKIELRSRSQSEPMAAQKKKGYQGKKGTSGRWKRNR